MKLITQAELAKKVGVSAAYINKLKKKGVLDGCFYGKKIREDCAIGAVESFRKSVTASKKDKNTTGIDSYTGDISRAAGENSGSTDSANVDKIKEDIKSSLPKDAQDAITESDVNKLATLLAKVNSPAARVSITKEFWAGKLNEIKYLKEKGKLLDKEEIESTFAEIALALREKFLSLPNRVSGVLATQSDKNKITNILEDEIREILENLALELKSEA